jgi:putative ABC transport system substrate-binding protein
VVVRLSVTQLVTVVALLLLAAPPTVAAQQAGTAPRIGLLSNGSPMSVSPQLEAFRRGLRELGWIEGQTVTIEYRWAEGNSDRLPALAADLARLKVDVIVLSGSPAIRAARDATSTIPLVFVMLADPVIAGFVPSLARPGGNMTGLASEFEELITKQLQLLKEALPKVSRVALLYHPEIATAIPPAAETAARKLGLTAWAFKVAGVAQFEHVFKTARSERVGAIHVLPSPFFNVHRRQLIELAARYRLPAVYEFKNYVDDGGLMSYGPSINEMYRGMASYVDLILRGAKPGDLPIKRPTTFELVINLRTARALGLTISPSLLVRADHVIE